MFGVVMRKFEQENGDVRIMIEKNNQTLSGLVI